MKKQEELAKKLTEEKEILQKMKLDKESAYLAHLRNNSQLLFPKTNENTKPNIVEKKTKELPQINNQSKTPINKKRPLSKKGKENKPNPKENNVDALDLEIRQSTEKLKKILKQYKKEDQDNYGKVVDDFVSNLEYEINQTENKSPFLESLDLGSSQKLSKNREIINKTQNDHTFGVQKLDFDHNIGKMQDFNDKLILEELIGYESEKSENDEKQNKNFNPMTKPFSANNVSRKEVDDFRAKAIKTENELIKKNEIIIEKSKNIIMAQEKNHKITNYPLVASKSKDKRKASLESNAKKEVPKTQKSDEKNLNSKFKNKLLGNIANSKNINSGLKTEKPPLKKNIKSSNNPNDQKIKVYFIFHRTII